MKTHAWIACPLALCSLLAAGCEAPPSADLGPDLNRAPLRLQATRAIEAGIIRERTIYPHHFVSETAVLNGVGRRDLQVLAHHFGHHPGALTLARGSADSRLYAARMTAVRYALQDSGIDASVVTIADGLPGGDGVGADDAIRILESKQDTGISSFEEPVGE